MNRRRFLGVLSSAVAGVKSGAAEKLFPPAASAVPPTWTCEVCGSSDHARPFFGPEYGCPYALPMPKLSSRTVMAFQRADGSIILMTRAAHKQATWKRKTTHGGWIVA